MVQFRNSPTLVSFVIVRNDDSDIGQVEKLICLEATEISNPGSIYVRATGYTSTVRSPTPTKFK